MIAQALQRALTAPEGLPLVTSKQAVGLFPSAAAGKEAAREAQASGLVRVLRSETKGKATCDYCTLTEKGLSYLLEQSSPRPVLEALLTAIDACQDRVDGWIASANANRQYLADVRGLAEQVLKHLRQPETTLPAWARNGHAFDPQTHIVSLLRAWHEAGKIGDFPLPDLFDQARAASSKLTLGQFHDALRALHDRRAIYLHPWTGPLHELPHPASSLLVGHEIAYYASLRSNVA